MGRPKRRYVYLHRAFLVVRVIDCCERSSIACPSIVAATITATLHGRWHWRPFQPFGPARGLSASPTDFHLFQLNFSRSDEHTTKINDRIVPIFKCHIVSLGEVSIRIAAPKKSATPIRIHRNAFKSHRY
jgi:hypothetical protein